MSLIFEKCHTPQVLLRCQSACSFWSFQYGDGKRRRWNRDTATPVSTENVNKIWLEILKAFIIICRRPYVAHCMLYVCILYTCVFGSIKTELEGINSRDCVFKMKNFCLNFYFVIKDMLIKIKMSLNFIWETKIYY